MPHLIIGHTTDTTARIWIQGDGRSRSCTVTLTGVEPRHTRLERAAGYVGVVVFDRLDPTIDYDVRVTFAPSRVAVHGRLRTHRPMEGAHNAFSFVLSSCNLSIVSITDLLAQMVGMAGMEAARTSLRLPLARWPWRRPLSMLLGWLKLPLRWLSQGLVWLATVALGMTTRMKQPSVEYLRSPFLKLSAVFESWVLTVTLAPDKDADGGFLSVGDHLEVRQGSAIGRGIVASLGEVVGGTRSVVLTSFAGHIDQHAVVCRWATVEKTLKCVKIGTVASVSIGRSWFPPPSFFLHAGDQIYYDFPKPDREPDRHEYRRAYREAWFEDEPLTRLLAHWPHYMTLDDHEIADQFATDFKPPSVKAARKKSVQAVRDMYLREATAAYREFVHALAPQEFQQRPATGPFWYTFAKGSAGFFVLDTRTRRRVGADEEDAKGEMIDGHQLKALLEWLELPYRPKFIVTSVPFVAELTAPKPDEAVKREWFREADNDKWCSPAFKKQRDHIIETIARKRIGDVVFLTGDMHCCYHATMRITVEEGRRGKPKKYEAIAVHELAGGPVNQLQLAKLDEFHRRRIGQTSSPTSRGGFTYEVRLEQFHADVAAVMHIALDYPHRYDTSPGAAAEPELVWNVIRTLTDPGPGAWAVPHTSRAGVSGPGPEPVMGGRITFTRRRTVDELQSW